MELELKNVSKEFKGVHAVSDVSVSMRKGVYGLLGVNGAGKTTLMRMLCTLIRPTSGEITWEGKNILEMGAAYRDVLGYLPQDFGYYPNFTGMDFMLYLAALKGFGKKYAAKKSKELLELVSLSEAANKKIKTYSGGMKQRIGIAQALLNDPKILVLDEPTAGLDPKERVRFRNLIAEIGKDSIVILSTHIVSDIEHIADIVLIMKDGQMIFDGQREEIKEDLEQFYLKKIG